MKLQPCVKSTWQLWPRVTPNLSNLCYIRYFWKPPPISSVFSTSLCPYHNSMVH